MSERDVDANTSYGSLLFRQWKRAIEIAPAGARCVRVEEEEEVYATREGPLWKRARVQRRGEIRKLIDRRRAPRAILAIIIASVAGSFRANAGAAARDADPIIPSR